MTEPMAIEELLATMRINERVSVVQLEPRDVTRWREAVELLAQLACAAAFDAGLGAAHLSRVLGLDRERPR